MSVISKMRAYANAHNLIILAFINETLSKDLVGVAIETCTDCNGCKYFTFGRLYHLFGDDCSYYQCGCSSFSDPIEVRKKAYAFFGIK